MPIETDLEMMTLRQLQKIAAGKHCVSMRPEKKRHMVEQNCTASVTQVNPTALTARNERLVFSLNACNAFAIKGILDQYSPMTSVGRYLNSAIVTDARKVVKMGIGRSFLRVLLIILHVELRLAVLPRAFFQDIR